LHSHGIAYGSGSGQQSITTHGAKDDQGGLWILKEGQNLPICEAGQEIKCGDIIRFQHLHTGKNLHSHLFKSPLTNNQEVSGFGDNGEGLNERNILMMTFDDR
jgi:dolichyl-phosphate-mannose--protein O-mannosyl transferase